MHHIHVQGATRYDRASRCRTRWGSDHGYRTCLRWFLVGMSLPSAAQLLLSYTRTPKRTNVIAVGASKDQLGPLGRAQATVFTSSVTTWV